TQFSGSWHVDARRTMSIEAEKLCASRFSIPSGELEAVELRGVGAGHLAALGFRHALEIVRNGAVRMRPGGVSVRVVGGPHEVVHADEISGEHADPVHDERGREVAPEVLARLELGVDAVLPRITFVA